MTNPKNDLDLRVQNLASPSHSAVSATQDLERLLLEQRKLLELIAAGKPARDCLVYLCSALSRLNSQAGICILLAGERSGSIQVTVSPDLRAFGAALEGVPVDGLSIGTGEDPVFGGGVTTSLDVSGDSRWSQPWREACAAHRVLACHSQPVVDHEGRCLGAFILCFDEPRPPTEWELRLADFGTHFASIAIEHDRSCSALLKSEQRYVTLLGSIDTGFCVLEIDFDAEGKAVNQRYLETNAVFEEQTGLKDPVGKTANEMIPDLDPEWFKIYGGVALTGEPVRFEKQALGRWYDIYAYRVDQPGDMRVGVIFKDISERKRAELNLAFLASLSEDLAHASSIRGIMDTVGARMGEFLGLSACSFAEIDQKADHAAVISDWHRQDVRPIDGTYQLADFLTDEFRACCHAGELFIVNDTAEDTRTDTLAFQNLGIGAVLCVPLLQNGCWNFLLSVYHSEPHAWSAAEIHLVEELTARIWNRLERARTEEALHESEARLRQIFEGAKDCAIFSVDLDGCFNSWNPGAERLFGYNQEEVFGQHCEIIFTPEDRASGIPQLEMDQARTSGVAEDERWHQRKDGSRLFASGLTQPIFDAGGQLTGFTKICQDRTAHHEAKNALERELIDNQRLQEVSSRLIAEGDFGALVGEILHAAIVVMHADTGSIQMVDGQSGDELRLLNHQGYSPELLAQVEYVGPTDHTSCMSALRKAGRVVVPNVDQCEGFLDTVFSGMLREAGVRAVQSTPLVSRSGRVLGIISTQWRHPHTPAERELRLLDLLARQAADLIERHQSEVALRERKQQLWEISQNLEQRVAQRTAELQAQTARLQSLAAELASAEQRERKRLAALLHDDLQQLLVAAGMQLGTIPRRLDDEVGNRAIAQATKWIGQAAHAARDLTRQLRPPALYEDGLIPALHWLASEMNERHRLKVIVDGGATARTLSDDIKALLFECVREMLFNAAKYAGVDHAIVTVTEQRNRLRIVVSDSGCGFDIETLSTPRHGGRFGLFSIRERLIALGGELTIESAPGKGTRIELEAPLPAMESPGISAGRMPPLTPTVAHLEARTAVATDQRTRVLVVDDHPMVREGIASILDADRRLVVSDQAADGIEAIQAMERHQPDVVLMDVNMPRMNGIEATREIRQRWPDTRIIGLSVQDDETTAKSMLDAGASVFVSKSGDSERMIAAILSLAPRKAPATLVRPQTSDPVAKSQMEIPGIL